jgi:DNA-binding response OmpR family regulator
MGSILLADDSAHARRMGETILREEGFGVRCVSEADGIAAAIAESAPDVVILDASLPGGGLELCRDLKARHPGLRVILTAGLLEPLDEEQARRAGCDGVLRKPFEASVMAARVRALTSAPDRERVRAAVEGALREALPGLVRELTEKVLSALER